MASTSLIYKKATQKCEEDMKKGQEYIGIVEQVNFPNKGIVLVEENPVIVKNTIPGQKIRFRIQKCKNKKMEGTLLEVLEHSTKETETPPCPHFGICGGCLYQTISYQEQSFLKAQQVKSLLNSVINEPYLFEDILSSPKAYEYRNKMEFSFGDENKDGPLTLGLHKKGSFYDIVSISDCKIVHQDFNQILSCVQKQCRKQELSFYHRTTHTGYLRHLLIRRAEKTKEILVDLVTTSNWKSEGTEQQFLEQLCQNIKELPLEGKIVGFLHTINDSLADVIKNDRTEILYGEEFFYEHLLELRFKISVFSFFQTNSLGAEILYQTVREFVGETKDKVIFDLYSGTGTITQLLAPVAKKVIGVEIIEEAVKAAKENAEYNKLNNCKFITGDVLKIIDEIEESPDILVLDPPRDGIHPKALKKILDYKVERLIYISCKPTSLCRDLIILQQNGYHVEKVRCVDLFPQVGHVETVVLIQRKDT